MNRLIKLTITAVFLLTLGSAQAAPTQGTEAVFKNLMTAIISNNYDGFVADCDDAMKAAITKPKLESVSKQVEPRAKGGYDSEYLGELNQKGFTVHLWRLRFKEGGDDILATLSMKDGKVGGFFLH